MTADWQAVREAVQARMRELNMSTAELARQSGLSATTLRYLGTKGRTNRVALIAISTVLRWRHDHLTNILHGEPEKNVRLNSPAANTRRAVYAEISPLREQFRRLEETVQAIDQKLQRAPKGYESPGVLISELPKPDDIDGDYTPQYVKLARILRDMITSGRLGRFNIIRAADLKQRYGVSVPVAYATLNTLAANGYIGRPDNSRSYQVTWDIGRSH